MGESSARNLAAGVRIVVGVLIMVFGVMMAQLDTNAYCETCWNYFQNRICIPDVIEACQFEIRSQYTGWGRILAAAVGFVTIILGIFSLEYTTRTFCYRFGFIQRLCSLGPCGWDRGMRIQIVAFIGIGLLHIALMLALIVKDGRAIFQIWCDVTDRKVCEADQLDGSSACRLGQTVGTGEVVCAIGSGIMIGVAEGEDFSNLCFTQELYARACTERYQFAMVTGGMVLIMLSYVFHLMMAYSLITAPVRHYIGVGSPPTVVPRIQLHPDIVVSDLPEVSRQPPAPPLL